jgi:hypothetical protein
VGQPARLSRGHSRYIRRDTVRLPTSFAYSVPRSRERLSLSGIAAAGQGGLFKAQIPSAVSWSTPLRLDDPAVATSGLITITLSPARQALLTELERALHGAAVDDWDGYGGAAVTVEARKGVRRFIALLSSDIPDPEITPGSRGEVTLDWYEGPRMIFSVSIADAQRLHYAGLFGESKAYGTESLGADLPQSVRLGISRALSGTDEKGI